MFDLTDRENLLLAGRRGENTEITRRRKRGKGMNEKRLPDSSERAFQRLDSRRLVMHDNSEHQPMQKQQ